MCDDFPNHPEWVKPFSEAFNRFTELAHFEQRANSLTDPHDMILAACALHVHDEGKRHLDVAAIWRHLREQYDIGMSIYTITRVFGSDPHAAAHILIFEFGPSSSNYNEASPSPILLEQCISLILDARTAGITVEVEPALPHGYRVHAFAYGQEPP
jgi:hypothetical protein